MNLLNMLMQSNFTTAFVNFLPTLRVILAIVLAICGLFNILVVLLQPGNSSGVSALGGTTETFLGRNKSKTFEHKMKKLTIISGIIMAVLCIVFFILATAFPV